MRGWRVRSIKGSATDKSRPGDRGLKRPCDHAVRFPHNVENCLVLKFEGLVDDHLTALSTYPGIEVQQSARVGMRYKNVERSRSYGEWLNWFTPADLEFYRPLFAAHINFFGYGGDYSLQHKQAINRRNSIDYIRQFKPRERMPLYHDCAAYTVGKPVILQ